MRAGARAEADTSEAMVTKVEMVEERARRMKQIGGRKEESRGREKG